MYWREVQSPKSDNKRPIAASFDTQVMDGRMELRFLQPIGFETSTETVRVEVSECRVH